MKSHVDENVVRLIAAQTVIITLITFVSQWKFPAFLLTADFALRAFTSQISPLAAVAGVFTDLLKLKPSWIFAAPKKFAAILGFVFSLAILIFLILKLIIAAYIAGSILILCALLESAFNICVGCYVYDWIVAPFVNRRNNKSKKTISDHD